MFNFEKIVKEELSKCFKTRLTEDKWMKRSAQDAYDRMTNYYNDNGEHFSQDEKNKQQEFKNRIDLVGRHIGVNIDKSQTPIAKNGVINFSNGKQRDYQSFLKLMTRLLRIKAKEISQYMLNNGAIPTEIFDNPNFSGDPSKKKPMTSEKASELMKFRDTLDALNLTYLYDIENQKALAPKTSRYNIDIERKLKDGGINVILDKFDLSDASLEEVVRWALKGTKGTTYKAQFAQMLGKSPDDITKEDFNSGDTFSIIKADYERKLVQKILDNAYGLSLQVMGGEDGKVFSMGNAKLPTDSLIINFTSAHRCLAWNDCLVKYACYARTSEHGYKDLLAKNKRLNLMWEGSHYDEELMKCMKNMIRCHCVSIQMLTNALNRVIVKQGRKSYRKNDKRYTVEDIYERLKKTGFYTFNDNELKVILENRDKIVRINDIRLNEEGDFIGQWLLDAIDDFAEELSLLNIKTAAYTCKHLNYDGIKNIIINASRANIGGHDGQQADAIVRRFYAVSQDTYNSFDETYASEISNDGTPLGNPTNPTYITNPTVFGDDYGHIVAYPQPLFHRGKDENGNDIQLPTGQYYYKCPCGRGKHGSDIKNNSALTQAFDNLTIPDGTKRLSVEKAKKKKKNKENAELSVNAVDCYDCRVCYQPKMAAYGNKPLIVLVQVHSENADLFDAAQADKRREDGGHRDYGKSEHFQDRYNDFKKSETKPKQTTKESVIKGRLTESVNNAFDEDEGLRLVAKNGERSVQKHLKNLSSKVNECKKVKKIFFENYERFFGNK